MHMSKAEVNYPKYRESISMYSIILVQYLLELEAFSSDVSIFAIFYRFFSMNKYTVL
jgi:hypothetical protein